MRYASWFLKAAAFLLLFGFALKNTAPATLRWYLGHEWQAPLVFLLLIAFALGAAAGFLAAWNQVQRLRQALRSMERRAAEPPPAASVPDEGA
jgi:uncharacterized integral membrane protein